MLHPLPRCRSEDVRVSVACQGFGMLDFGSGVYDWMLKRSECMVESLGFKVLGFGFWVLGFGFWVLGFGFWVLGFGFYVLGFGF